MVAAITAVGTGEIDLQELKELIQSKDRSRTPRLAPAHGLYLLDVIYPEYKIYDSSLTSWHANEKGNS